MKTKKYIKYIIIGFVSWIGLFNSCTNLDETVYDQIISEKFNPTGDDAFSIMAPVYINMRNVVFGWIGYFDVQEECSDQILTPVRPNGWDDGGVYKVMHKHTWTTDQYQLGALWNRCYSGINAANRVIYMVESGKLPIEQGKEGFLAELKVARAFYYFLLCDNFGNVPIVTKYDVEQGYLPDQNTRQQVYDFVVGEITSNLSSLSTKIDQSTYGRFNKYAAMAVLAKVYLNAGIYTGTPQWTKCSQMCDSIIKISDDTKQYDLETVYNDIFKTENQNSKEIVFAIPFDDKYGPWFHLHMKTLHPANQATYSIEESPWGGNCAIPQFIDTYDPDDTRLKNTWISGLQFAANGDTLKCSLGDATRGKPLIYTNTVASLDSTGENEGYRIGKYEIKMGAKGMLSNDFPFIRYADILMMKAECLLRTGNADAAAIIVTKVRQRAFSSTNPSKATVTGADLVKGSVYNYGVRYKEVLVAGQGGEGGTDIQYGRFLDELGWEFAAEAHRRQDLIRFGVFTTKAWLSHKPSASYRALFPIPKAQRDKNSKLQQNPGY